MRRGLALLARPRASTCCARSPRSRDEWRDEPTLGYTHLQPAQLTTVGKRATLWMQDLVLDLADLDHRTATLPFRGVKGTTGTQASFLELFDGDHEKVRRARPTGDREDGLPASHSRSPARRTRASSTRRFSRVVAGIAASAAKFSGDIRMLQAFGEIEEPFESEQIGSSAMAYKRNPMRSERIASLARFVNSLEANANQTHAVQFFERTLDDSANRRLVIPGDVPRHRRDPAAHGRTSRAGSRCIRRVIERRVAAELPFMATEELIVRAVRAGGDRQDAHERSGSTASRRRAP